MDFMERQNFRFSVGICCTNILILLDYRKILTECSNFLAIHFRNEILS